MTEAPDSWVFTWGDEHDGPVGETTVGGLPTLAQALRYAAKELEKNQGLRGVNVMSVWPTTTKGRSIRERRE